VRILCGFIGLLASAFQTQLAPAATGFQEHTHFSQVMNANRAYRIALPSGYDGSQKRYPVIYWLQGYEQPDETREAEIARYAATHDVIVVEAGPVETSGEFPLYFPELANRIDTTLRTLPDREHRAVTGFATAGFLAFWIAGKFPHLVGSASSIMGPTEALVGPRDLDTEFPLDDFPLNYDGVRTRLATGAAGPLRFYQGRLNSIWLHARSGHETGAYTSGPGTPGIAKTLDFHMHAFTNPLPRPAVFQHADVYPNFAVWGWEVTSDRRQPGFTVLENVSPAGFRSAVREWVPGGGTLPEVKLTVLSAPLYAPGSTHSASFFRLHDGKTRRAPLKADPQGRLSFDLDGDAWEVSIDSTPRLAVTGYRFARAEWATAGAPVQLRVGFVNAGATRSATEAVRWESPDPSAKFSPLADRLFGLAPGESAELPVTVTMADDGRAAIRIDIAVGGNRIPILLPVFPAAAISTAFRIADGRTATVFRHGAERAEQSFGEGNGDGHAAPGESFAVLLPEGDASRPAELFTADPCLDDSLRAADSWADYDHSGNAAVYSLPAIRPDCAPGHIVHALARVLIPTSPDYRYRYAAIEFPVWYRRGEEPK